MLSDTSLNHLPESLKVHLSLVCRDIRGMGMYVECAFFCVCGGRCRVHLCALCISLGLLSGVCGQVLSCLMVCGLHVACVRCMLSCLLLPGTLQSRVKCALSPCRVAAGKWGPNDPAGRRHHHQDRERLEETQYLGTLPGNETGALCQGHRPGQVTCLCWEGSVPIKQLDWRCQVLPLSAPTHLPLLQRPLTELTPETIAVAPSGLLTQSLCTS